jgi:hypothetical protein
MQKTQESEKVVVDPMAALVVAKVVAKVKEIIRKSNSLTRISIKNQSRSTEKKQNTTAGYSSGKMVSRR